MAKSEEERKCAVLSISPCTGAASLPSNLTHADGVKSSHMTGSKDWLARIGLNRITRYFDIFAGEGTNRRAGLPESLAAVSTGQAVRWVYLMGRKAGWYASISIGRGTQSGTWRACSLHSTALCVVNWVFHQLRRLAKVCWYKLDAVALWSRRVVSGRGGRGGASGASRGEGWLEGGLTVALLFPSVKFNGISISEMYW